jgi:hypothetical protein
MILWISASQVARIIGVRHTGAWFSIIFKENPYLMIHLCVLFGLMGKTFRKSSPYPWRPHVRGRCCSRVASQQGKHEAGRPLEGMHIWAESHWGWDCFPQWNRTDDTVFQVQSQTLCHHHRWNLLLISHVIYNCFFIFSFFQKRDLFRYLVPSLPDYTGSFSFVLMAQFFF